MGYILIIQGNGRYALRVSEASLLIEFVIAKPYLSPQKSKRRYHIR